MNVRTQQNAAKQIVCVPHPGEQTEQPVQGELTAWYVEPGELVKPGQRLFQISWPGVVIDYTADTTGVVANRHGRLRETVTSEASLLELRLAESLPEHN